jgi:hypothetical protein
MKTYFTISALIGLILLGSLSCCQNRAEERRQVSEIPQTVNQRVTEEKGYKIDTQQFLERVKRKTTPAELRSWALKVLSTYADVKQSFYLSSNETPAFVLGLDPPIAPSVVVNPNASVTIVWGGGFGSWGLYVVPENSELTNSPPFYVIKWAPGVEAFHDLQ